MTGPRSSVTSFDGVVVGAGPNGLVAAIRLASAGRRVLLVEGAETIGGGLRSAALTRPGFVHDICAAVHPLGLASPALRALPLERHGVEWLQPEAPLAHPLDGARVAFLERSVERTAVGLGEDAAAYRALFDPLVRNGRAIVDTVLDPIARPRAPLALARFGLHAVRPATSLARSRFTGDAARALVAGVASHSILPLTAPATAGYALLLMLLGHTVGWPIVAGGSQVLADALGAVLADHGGEILTATPVASLADLPPARSRLLDLAPRHVLALAGDRLPSRHARAFARYRHGPGVWKVDWALDGPIPWQRPDVARAATVHLGGTLDEIEASERDVATGRLPDRPFVILVQPTTIDPTRAPAGKHTAWAYCHVPNGCPTDMTGAIEAQVERFAPGFRDRILARHSMGPAAFEAHDPNYVGGDIGGGAGDLRQLFARPVASFQPWVLPVPGLYLCSASTPPGAGVHGMCGWHAATAALHRDRD